MHAIIVQVKYCHAKCAVSTKQLLKHGGTQSSTKENRRALHFYDGRRSISFGSFAQLGPSTIHL